MKQEADLPFGSVVYRNVDEVELRDQNALVMDGYITETGGVARRPGLYELYDFALGNEVTGIYYWPHKDYAIAVVGERVYKLVFTATTISPTNLTGTGIPLARRRATFATDGTQVLIANGGRIMFTDGTTTTAFIADGDAPTAVTHVAYLDGYILANNANSNRFYWSKILDYTDWSALNFASAAGNADYITALHVFNREIFLFGPASTEIWENDGSSPFSRTQGGYIDNGTIAPNSIVSYDNDIYWLDSSRHFVRYKGRGIERISSVYDKEIQAFSDVTDCAADKIEIGGKTFLTWHFPAAGRTLVLNVTNPEQPTWTEWGHWNSMSGVYERWLGNCHAYVPTWNYHVVGGHKETKLYAMSFDYYTDAAYGIRMLQRTGHMDHGTYKRKRSHDVYIRAKRGSVVTSTAPILMFRFRNEDGAWSQWRNYSLGKTGETNLLLHLRQLGIYRTRQYELAVSDSCPVTLSGAREVFEVLAR